MERTFIIKSGDDIREYWDLLNVRLNAYETPHYKAIIRFREKKDSENIPDNLTFKNYKAVYNYIENLENEYE